MPQSFFKNLLRQQSTDDRSNLENFLSEILCEYLNRMDVKHQKLILSALLNIGQEELLFTNRLVWRTRVSILVGDTWKYPDMMAFRMNKPYIVFENKIDASFTQHRIDTRDNDTELQEQDVLNQLEIYGQWLHAIEPVGFLVLLTKSTKPPGNFLDTSKPFKFKIQRRHLTTWQHIFNFAKRQTDISIGADFIALLEEEGLAMDSPGRLDFSILDLWVKGAKSRLIHLMEKCREGLLQEFGDKIFNWKAEEKWMAEGASTSHEDSMYWAWVIRRKLPYTYIGYGFHFPDRDKNMSSNWGEILRENYPRQPFAFVGIFTNSATEGKTVAAKFTSEEWSVGDRFQDQEQIVALSMVSLDELLENENIDEVFQIWVIERFREAQKAIK